METIFCPRCGAKSAGELRTCAECGYDAHANDFYFCEFPATAEGRAAEAQAVEGGALRGYGVAELRLPPSGMRVLLFRPGVTPAETAAALAARGRPLSASGGGARGAWAVAIGAGLILAMAVILRLSGGGSSAAASTPAPVASAYDAIASTPSPALTPIQTSSARATAQAIATEQAASPKPTKRPKPTRAPAPKPTPRPDPSIKGVSPTDILVVAQYAGLECDTPEGAMIDCSGESGSGTGFGLSTADNGAGQIAEVTAFAEGDETEAYFFLSTVCGLLGSNAQAAAGWIADNAGRSVVEKNFGKVHAVYRGPLDLGTLTLTPRG